MSFCFSKALCVRTSLRPRLTARRAVHTASRSRAVATPAAPAPRLTGFAALHSNGRGSRPLSTSASVGGGAPGVYGLHDVPFSVRVLGADVYLYEAHEMAALFHDVLHRVADACLLVGDQYVHAVRAVAAYPLFATKRANSFIGLFGQTGTPPAHEVAAAVVAASPFKPVDPKPLEALYPPDATALFFMRTRDAMAYSDTKVDAAVAEQLYRDAISKMPQYRTPTHYRGPALKHIGSTVNGLELLPTTTKPTDKRGRSDFHCSNGVGVNFTADLLPAATWCFKRVDPDTFAKRAGVDAAADQQRAVVCVHPRYSSFAGLRTLRFGASDFNEWSQYVTACRRDDDAAAQKALARLQDKHHWPAGPVDTIEGPMLVSTEHVPERTADAPALSNRWPPLPPLPHVFDAADIPYLRGDHDHQRLHRPIAFGHQLTAVSEAAVEVFRDLLKRKEYDVLVDTL